MKFSKTDQNTCTVQARSREFKQKISQAPNALLSTVLKPPKNNLLHAIVQRTDSSQWVLRLIRSQQYFNSCTGCVRIRRRYFAIPHNCFITLPRLKNMLMLPILQKDATITKDHAPVNQTLVSSFVKKTSHQFVVVIHLVSNVSTSLHLQHTNRAMTPAWMRKCEISKWRVQKENWISPFADFQKKKTEFRHKSAHETDRDPSLGILGQNFILSSNIRPVRSGLPGIPDWARRPKLPVWTRNSGFRVARTILIADSESTQHLGLKKVMSGMFGYLWAEIQASTEISGRPGPTEPQKPGRSLYFGPQIPYRYQILRRIRICNQNRPGYL